MNDDHSAIKQPGGPLRRLPGLRWWIGGLLFLSTVINYLDRQTLSVLAPFLKNDYHWNNEDFALVVISFRVAYTIGQVLSGRLLDRVGTRRGLSMTVIWYSTAAMLTSLAGGLRSFCLFRFLLGAGESANWPGATKAVAEWFPKKDRGWAVALFDSGSSIGGAIAPFMVFWLYKVFGGWQPAFIIVGSLGFFWLIAWRFLYYPPEHHPRIEESERTMILEDKADTTRLSAGKPALSWWQLLKLPQTWGVIVGKTFTDPVWFFIADWFAIYLVAKGIKLEEGLFVFWIPFIAADLGNFFGGGLSSWLIRRGWPVGRARKAVILIGGFGMALLAPNQPKFVITTVKSAPERRTSIRPILASTSGLTWKGRRSPAASRPSAINPARCPADPLRPQAAGADAICTPSGRRDEQPGRNVRDGSNFRRRRR